MRLGVETLAVELSSIAQFFLDTKKLIVLGHAVRTTEGASLDLAGVCGYSDIGNGGIFGFTRAVGGDGGVTGTVSHLDGIEGFSEGPDLVDLDENGVGAS